VDLAVKSLFDGRFPLFTLCWLATLARFLWLHWRLLRRFLLSDNGCGIPTYMPDKLLAKILLHQRIVYPVAKLSCGKFAEGTRKCRLRGNVTGSNESAYTP
jgi:hypothetical protein